MRITDYIEQSFGNLWKKKLRTFLTTFGVIIGIGALVALMSFGVGVQKNISEQFKELELFNFIAVYPGDMVLLPSEDPAAEEKKSNLDDAVIEKIRRWNGVDLVFPDVRFPALVKIGEEEQFSFVQVLPADITTSRLMKLREGEPYTSEDESSLIISDTLLLNLEQKDFSSQLGQKIQVSTLSFDFSAFNPSNVSSYLLGEKLPFSVNPYPFTIAGVAERLGFGSPIPLQSDIYISPEMAENMKKLVFSDILDLFRSSEKKQGYSLVTVRASSPKLIGGIKTKIENLGFRTFALIDQFEEMKKGFLIMDLFLAALGMIAIFVSLLGIANTMLMSIFERYKEIGIMKAIGASDRDIKKIFLFESGAIGLFGGIFGFVLGWIVSNIINQIVNYFLAKQGIPFIDYFHFPWWLGVGAVLFAVVVSLIAGIYPTIRAARIDPVSALRHE